MSGMDRLTELLPCPFCGDNHATTTYTRDGRLVVCTSCGAKSGNYYHGPKDLPSADERAIAAWNCRASQAAPAPSDGLREAAATILAVLEDPDSLPIEKHPDWQAIYNAMTADHNESVEISGDSWHDWPSILIAGLEVMAQDSAALSASPAQEGGSPAKPVCPICKGHSRFDQCSCHYEVKP